MKPGARRKARQFALQAMYQWQLAGTDISAIEIQFFEDFDFKDTDKAYFRELLYGIPKQASTLDEYIRPLLDRSIDELGPVEWAILRISCYELLNRLDVPYRVVINEGIELAKVFGATEAHKYINGVLDKLAQQLRTMEIEALKD